MLKGTPYDVLAAKNHVLRIATDDPDKIPEIESVLKEYFGQEKPYFTKV